MNRLFHYYVDKHIHIALSMVLFYWFQCKVYDVFAQWPYTIFLFFSIIFAYNVHDIPRNASTIKKVSIPLIVSLLGSFISFFWLPFSLAKYIIPIGVITLLYTYAILPGKKKLRDIPYIKIFILSGVLSFMSTIVPFVSSGKPMVVVLLMFTSRFIFFFLLCMLFDIRDTEKDQTHGVTTLGTNVSHSVLKWFGVFLIIILTFFEIYFANSFISDLPELVAMVFSALSILPFLFPLRSHPRTTRFSFLCDGVIALPYLIYMVVTFLNI